MAVSSTDQVGLTASNQRKASTETSTDSTDASMRTRTIQLLQYTGRKVISGLEWLFGIESVEEEDSEVAEQVDDINHMKREVQQNRWHRVIHGTSTIETEPEGLRSRYPPKHKIAIPENPKPHVWKVAWRGVKYVCDQVYKETPPSVAVDEPEPPSVAVDESEPPSVAVDEPEPPSVTVDAPDGVPGRRPQFFSEEPVQVRGGDVSPPPGAYELKDKFHRLGLTGKVLFMDFHEVRDNAYDKLNKDRPYFTYWVTFVQVLVMIVVSAVYGYAPYGWAYQTEMALIQRTNLGIEPTTRTITTNIWGGPSQEDLVLLGARYAPCMRRDERLFDLIEQDRIIESDSGCCIRNDDSGCVQVNNEKECPSPFAEFRKNDTTVQPPQPIGVVCGQSPRTCLSPRSQPPHQWSNDITLWPICEESASPSNQSFDDHLTCEITGRPCCIGILAKCVIATLDFCNYMNGRFHEEATLCSQVNCLDDVCGLISFVREDEPDQFYRIWLSLFLHAGWIHLLFTFVFNAIILRDVEKFICGWFKVSIIYLGSGFAGNIFSGIFIPYFPAVGPAGSLMGIISTLLVYVWLERKRFKYPIRETLKLLALVLVALIIGLLPNVDNFAHIGGLATGILLSFIFVSYHPPFEDLASLRIHRLNFRWFNIMMVIICLVTFIAIYVVIFVLFYEVQPNCSGCQYFTCIPFTDTICEGHEPTPENRDRNL